MENRYIITLSSSDKLIATWKSKALAAGQEKMSTLVKNAILTFIEKGEFLDIGHIHFDPENVTVKKGDVIPLQTARTPIIRRWIEENKAAGLDVSGPIKLLLSKCIRVIADSEPEYFPPPKSSHEYSEANILTLMKANAAKITEQSSVRKNIATNERTSAQGKTDVSTEASITVSKQVVSSEKETGQTLKGNSLTNKSPITDPVVRGMDSLLPQRAVKKS